MMLFMLSLLFIRTVVVCCCLLSLMLPSLTLDSRAPVTHR